MTDLRVKLCNILTVLKGCEQEAAAMIHQHESEIRRYKNFLNKVGPTRSYLEGINAEDEHGTLAEVESAGYVIDRVDGDWSFVLADLMDRKGMSKNGS